MTLAALPSRATEMRERRLRSIRLVLDRHSRVLSGERDTVLGCGCGWSVPNGLSGYSAHRDHLAAELVSES